MYIYISLELCYALWLWRASFQASINHRHTTRSHFILFLYIGPDFVTSFHRLQSNAIARRQYYFLSSFPHNIRVVQCRHHHDHDTTSFSFKFSTFFFFLDFASHSAASPHILRHSHFYWTQFSRSSPLNRCWCCELCILKFPIVLNLVKWFHKNCNATEKTTTK